jgi:Lysophospholipase catalytic domain
MPFPIGVMDQAKGGSLVNAQDVNVPILETNPYEFGDWNSTRGFINTKM